MVTFRQKITSQSPISDSGYGSLIRLWKPKSTMRLTTGATRRPPAFRTKYLASTSSGTLSSLLPEYSPARATASAFVETSVPVTEGRRPSCSMPESSAVMAMVYASSPVEHPADQKRRERLADRLRSTSSGITRFLSTSNCWGKRKKLVSLIVTRSRSSRNSASTSTRCWK